MTRSGRRWNARGVIARARASPLVGWVDRWSPPGCTLALAVGRRAGKATVRSRAKRILRATFREAAPQFPDGTRLTIAVEADISHVPRRAIRQAARRLLRQLTAA